MESLSPRFLLLISFAGLLWPVAQLEAHSYYIRPMTADQVPGGVKHVTAWHQEVSQWITPKETRKLGMVVPEPGAIERFFKWGVHWGRDPYQFGRKDPNTPEKRMVTAMTRTRPVDNTDEWSRRLKFRSFHGAEGALASTGGMIYRWRLQSPTVLMVEGSAGVCYLTLPESKAVKLVPRTYRQADAGALPLLPKGNLRCMGDFIRMGRMETLNRKILDSFLAEGTVMEREPRTVGLNLLGLPITTFWFDEERSHLSGRESFDLAGNPIVGSSRSGSFSSLFLDAEERPWKAKLISDVLLQFDSGHTPPVFLELAELKRKGHGQRNPADDVNPFAQ